MGYILFKDKCINYWIGNPVQSMTEAEAISTAGRIERGDENHGMSEDAQLLKEVI